MIGGMKIDTDEDLLLLVDDDDWFRERLARALGQRGYTVVTAASGAAALAMQPLSRFAFAIFDLRLPDMNGLECIMAFRSHNTEARLVVLTGYGSIASAVEAMRRGAADYLTKPVDADQVDAALRNSPPSLQSMYTPSLARLEWEHIQRVLADTGHNISETARLLGLDRRTLQRKLAKYPPGH